MSNPVQTVINAVTPDLITKLSGLLGVFPGSAGKGVSAAAKDGRAKKRRTDLVIVRR